MANTAINIFLICDLSIFRTALRMLIESENRFQVVGEASDANTAVEQIAKLRPNIILVDVSDIDERALLPLSSPEIAKIPVLILTRKDQVEFYQQCLKLGIKGLVSKQNGAEVLYKAIEKVCEGEFWFDRSIMGATIRHMLNEKQSFLDNPAVQKANGMTEREREVVELICRGMKNKGIAEKLFIAETTVRHHLTSVFNKLDVTSRLELVIYAFKHQLVKVPSLQNSFEENGSDGQDLHYLEARS
ncbi:MAG: response regulator transcription factor [Chloracidobacterium sp.]|nr:response regulator transcription factor [Chloracidobacterium sp.]